jgi:hypothetical protein
MILAPIGQSSRREAGLVFEGRQAHTEGHENRPSGKGLRGLELGAGEEDSVDERYPSGEAFNYPQFPVVRSVVPG